MAVNQHVSTLAEVTSGWTGTVSIVVGAATVTHTPPATTSAVTVLEALEAAVARELAPAVLDAWTTAARQVFMRMATAFDVVATGTTMGRLGLTGALTGASSYTFPLAVPSTLAPSIGIGSAGAEVALSPGVALAAGGGARYGTLAGAGKTITVYGTMAEVVAANASLDDGKTYDLTMWAERSHRIRVRSTKLERWTRGGERARCVVDAVAVSQ